MKNPVAMRFAIIFNAAKLLLNGDRRFHGLLLLLGEKILLDRMSADFLFTICRAMGAHSLERFQVMPNRLDSALIKIVDRATSTRSGGKVFRSRRGELELSSCKSYPPGRFCAEPSNNQITNAAAASRLAPSLTSTPRSNAKALIFSKSSGVPFSWRSSSAIINFANISCSSSGICLTCPKSMSPTSPFSSMKILPGCASVNLK